MRLVKLAAFALLAQASFLAASAMAAMDGNTMEITLGKVIERNWADVQKGKYAYAAKQDYNVGRKETHIYLPYGRTDGVYFELERAKLVDPAPGSVAKLAPSDMQGATRLGLKFRAYPLATSEAQRTIIASAGQAMLSVGQSHTPGTFMAFFLSE